MGVYYIARNSKRFVPFVTLENTLMIFLCCYACAFSKLWSADFISLFCTLT